MQILSKWLKLFLVLLAAHQICASDQHGDAAARAIVDAENNFCKMAHDRGVRSAFLAFLADDSIVFRPGPVSGKKVWSERPESSLDLFWQPIFAAAAESGDFGYDTGPAKWKKDKADEKFLGYGQFVSIWKKQSDGSWKVAVDIGTENPEPTTAPNAPEIFSSVGREHVDLVAARQAFEKTQSAFATMAKEDSLKALWFIAGENIRVLREGEFPTVGKNEIAKTAHGPMSIQVRGGDVSRSGDLAYSYGEYSIKRVEENERGNFLQIWQRDASNEWKLVMELEQKIPPR